MGYADGTAIRSRSALAPRHYGLGLRRSHADSHHSPRCNRHVYPSAHHCQRSNTGSHPDANTCIYAHADPDAHNYAHADCHTNTDSDAYTYSSAAPGLVFGPRGIWQGTPNS